MIICEDKADEVALAGIYIRSGFALSANSPFLTPVQMQEDRGPDSTL